METGTKRASISSVSLIVFSLIKNLFFNFNNRHTTFGWLVWERMIKYNKLGNEISSN